MKTRDHSVDLLRGIAALNIILIHTTFWSGEFYVPELVKSISLCLDVPFFFFLAGISSAYANSFNKNMRSLLSIYAKYVLFWLFYVVLLLVIGLRTNEWSGFTLPNLYGNLFFLRAEKTQLPVVMGSIWFMPVYFTVVPIGAALLEAARRLSDGASSYYKKVCCLTFVVFMGLLYTWFDKTFFLLSSQTCFYLFFYLLGVLCKDVKIKHLGTAILLLASDVLLMKGLGTYFGWNIRNMQQMKFPPNIVFLLYSCLTIVIALYARSKLQTISGRNVFCWIGRSAIFFYFAQGISSSLIYRVLPHIRGTWYYTLPRAYLINVGMAVCFVIILKFLNKQATRAVGAAVKCFTHNRG